MTRPRALIAVVDDEEPIRKALGSLESLPDHRPDCVVLDLHMPLVLDAIELGLKSGPRPKD